jgi:3-deoxy-D-arabino-heptulosonate 7-phosphate (DAHP) synthase class II
VIITTEPTHYPDADLNEASNQHHKAASALRTIATALDTIPKLCGEIRRLRSRLADLVAAARATLSAHDDGEPDALYYLRDELEAQGYRRHDNQERP